MSFVNQPNSTGVRSLPIRQCLGPAGETCIVALAWHVDGEAGVIAAAPEAAWHLTALSEGSYGVSTALPRILQMHRDLGIPGTFFVPGYVAELHPQAVEAIVADGHEVAHHGYRHENCFPLDLNAQREIFQKGTEALRHLIGRDPLGWSAPCWGVNPDTLNLLYELGFRYDCSLMEYDRPYWLAIPQGHLLELPISMVLDDWGIFGGSPYSGTGVNGTAESAYQIWREEFEGIHHYGGFFSTSFHPNLTGRPGRLRMLYRLIEYMQSFERVWWATCGEVAEYIQHHYPVDPSSKNCERLPSQRRLAGEGASTIDITSSAL
ncbi:MAG: polysaccharide deacetylase [Cyanobacteriota bacterium]|nr:polysaccharide deacetylase [Cyanobacteriota bacterium]